MKTILSIIGARPQFIKHAPLQLALQKKFNALSFHTGQHYDPNMSQIFFDELGIPEPEYQMDLDGLKTHGEQTSRMIMDIENVCMKIHPDALLVYGDTNSTLAGALVASKLCIPVIHIEAGLRSYNREMPEEINRILTDVLSGILFCPTKEAVENLKKEGITKNVFVTGDVMMDTLYLVKDKIKAKLEYPYYFATIHRPYNTDAPERLLSILSELNQLKHKVVLAIHPRTRSRIKTFGYAEDDFSNIQFIDPVGYIDSLSYQQFSEAVITDSGGMQKEAYTLRKKCLTIRSETEWTETLKGNWNQLVFDHLKEISNKLNIEPENYRENLYGDGNAAGEILETITNFL